jgi:hypothetical protein
MFLALVVLTRSKFLQSSQELGKWSNPNLRFWLRMLAPGACGGICIDMSQAKECTRKYTSFDVHNLGIQLFFI